MRAAFKAGLLSLALLAAPAAVQAGTVEGVAIGAGVGAAVAGPPGAVVGGVAGAITGGPNIVTHRPTPEASGCAGATGPGYATAVGAK